jgi:NADPH:quinone reductase
MKAWLLDKIGSIDNLRMSPVVADPKPAANEVVLELLFAALNPADRYLAEGAYPARPSLPHILGRDGIGRVAQVGLDVTGTRVGDIRAIVRGDTGVSRPGTFAEKVAVEADSLVDLPRGWSMEQAAGATLVYLTAYQAITQWKDLPEAGCVTLITGASGGVGVASAQLAKAFGHTVVGLSRDSEKRTKLLSLGCDFVLDATAPTWPKHLAERVGKKVNLCIDNIGGPMLNDVLTVMDYGGRISCVGRLAGPVPNFNTASLFFRRLQIGGVAVGTYSRVEAIGAWGHLLDLMNSAKQTPVVDQVFGFADLPAAFDRLKQGPMGKVLLKIV